MIQYQLKFGGSVQDLLGNINKERWFEMSSNNTSEEEMLRSICNDLGVPNLVEILGDTSLRRLQPLLIHAWKKRVASKRPERLLADYESKLEFYGVGTIPQNKLYEFAQVCQASVPRNFDIVQTSPITPLGVNSVLSKISQNNTLPTIRGSEVVSDVTSQLALECAHRRKKILISNNSEVVNLCSLGRVLRLQPFDKQKGYMQHFNLFTLCSGGANSIDCGGFAVPWIRNHIAVLIDVLSGLQGNGYYFDDMSVHVSDMRFLQQLIAVQRLPMDEIIRNSLNDDFDLFKEYNINFPREVDATNPLTKHDFDCCKLPDYSRYFQRIDDNILSLLRIKYPKIRFCFDFVRKGGIGYYPHLCFHIFACKRDGKTVQLGDGGAVDWLAKLLGNRREAMVTSGIGSELIQKLFNPEI